jgi:flagellar hook-length control protein FliK
MIHTLSALPAGGPVGHGLAAKAGKGSSEAVLSALFGKALAAEVQAGEAAVAAGVVVPAESDTLAQLAGEATIQAADAGTQADQAAGEQTPAQSGVDAFALAAAGVSPGLPAAVLAAQTETGVATAGVVQPGQDLDPGELTRQGQTEPLVGEVPAAQRNPLVVARQKNLPVTPAGIAANPQALEPRGPVELPAGIQMKMGMGDALDLRPAAANNPAGMSMPWLTGEAGTGESASSQSAAAGMAGVSVLAGSEARSGPRQVVLVTPFGQATWSSELADKVVWLAGQRGQVAELSLSPPSLGGIEVRLNLTGQEAGAQFFSANPTVREAIEAALPKLREMMAEAGLTLGQATVSSEPFRQHQAAPQQTRPGRAGGDQDESVALAGILAGPASRVGLVDLYV